MIFLKYILLTAVPLSVLLERFLKTKKDDDPEAKNYSRSGLAVFVVLPIVLFIIGLILSITDDQKAAYEKEISQVEKTRDSTLLANRWQFDTLRLKQLLDSSYKIIAKSNENLKKTESNLNISSNLMKRQNELYNQVTGGSSIPLITADVDFTIGIRGYRVYPQIIYIKLTNNGFHAIDNVSITFYQNKWHQHFEPMDSLVFIGGSTSKLYKQIILFENSEPYPIETNSWKFLVCWKNTLCYSFSFSVKRISYENRDLTIGWYDYEFKGKSYTSIDELQDQIIRVMNKNKLFR